jgi:hypothetical protein
MGVKKSIKQDFIGILKRTKVDMQFYFVLRGASINGAAASSRQVLRHVRRHAHIPALAYKLRDIETLVAAHGYTLASRTSCNMAMAAPRSAVPSLPFIRSLPPRNYSGLAHPAICTVC